MSALSMFIPITKVDAAQRLVYGLATAETADRSGEVCDYASTKPYYEAWSGAIHKSTDGKSMGNVRAMHGKVAAGKVTSLNFNDDAKQIEICAKVVDDAEWNKVAEGVYTGFSQGGAYVKRWKDDAGLQRYTADPSEVSLVDLPCLPSATFQMIKADGIAEEKHFKAVIEEPKAPTNDEIAAKAREIAKAAGDETKWADHVEPAREALIKAAAPVVADKVATRPVDADEWEQVWKSKRDGVTFKTKAELRKHHEDLDAAEVVAKAAGPALDALKGINEALGIAKAAEPTAEEIEAAKAAELAKAAAAKPARADLAKDLYTVSWLAQTLMTLQSLAQSSEWEEMYEGDGSSDVPAKLKALLAQACDILRDMVNEETGELFEEGALPDILVLEAAAGKLPADRLAALIKFSADKPALSKARPVFEKVGARNSKSDKAKIQAMHDNSVDLGADCSGSAEKAHGANGLEKIAGELAKMTAERDGLQKAIDDKIMPALVEIGKRVKNIEAQPLPLPFSGAPRAVSKGGDRDEPDDQQLEKMLATPEGREAIALLMIKASQRNGQSMAMSR